jgi:hypothetical protein
MECQDFFGDRPCECRRALDLTGCELAHCAGRSVSALAYPEVRHDRG